MVIRLQKTLGNVSRLFSILWVNLLEFDSRRKLSEGTHRAQNKHVAKKLSLLHAHPALRNCWTSPVRGHLSVQLLLHSARWPRARPRGPLWDARDMLYLHWTRWREIWKYSHYESDVDLESGLLQLNFSWLNSGKLRPLNGALRG